MPRQFTSIDALKRRAKIIGKTTNLKHHLALDSAAQEGGFNNFRHALTSLSGAQTALYPVALEQLWYNRRARTHGVEVIQVNLRQPLRELVKPHHLVGYLGGCHLKGDDTLILYSGDYIDDHAEYAKRRANQIARALQFMEITGLRPSRAARCYPKGLWHNRPPIADHDHRWFDPTLRQFVLSTEPYPSRLDRMQSEMDQWANLHDFSYVQVDWGSIYGLSTQLWLAAKAGTGIDLLRFESLLRENPTHFIDE